MKYVKGFDYQVCVIHKDELVASMYFKKFEDAENHYNEMCSRMILFEGTIVSLRQYALQYECTSENYHAYL